MRLVGLFVLLHCPVAMLFLSMLRLLMRFILNEMFALMLCASQHRDVLRSNLFVGGRLKLVDASI